MEWKEPMSSHGNISLGLWSGLPLWTGHTPQLTTVLTKPHCLTLGPPHCLSTVMPAMSPAWWYLDVPPNAKESLDESDTLRTGQFPTDTFSGQPLSKKNPWGCKDFREQIFKKSYNTLSCLCVFITTTGKTQKQILEFRPGWPWTVNLSEP